jgi:hypothetical protein
MMTWKRRSYKSSSSDGDNNNVTRSTRTRASIQTVSYLTISTMLLLSVVICISPTVQGFSTAPSYSGKESFANQQQQRQQQTNSFVAKIHQQLEQEQYCSYRPVATRLSAGTINTDNSDGEQRQRQQQNQSTDDGYDGLGEYDPSENLPQRQREAPIVGNPQLRVKEKERSVTNILKELAAIQQQGPQKYSILGTRHCSYLHQQIIELLAYALVLSGNHVFTSGAGGTHA